MAGARNGGRGWDDRWTTYPASKPLPVTGGIATSKMRGAMAESWWSKRFTDVLESYGLGARMTRGKSYARSGQVLSLDVTAGLLVAQVQGSRRVPYAITVQITPPTAAQWRKIDDLLRARAGYAAAMLAGVVPAELETAFADARCALFPTRWGDLRATCSCPDWGDPCKHQAAVLYVFADRLDTDPWQLLAWHGRSRDQILELFAVTSSGGDDTNAAAIAPWWPLRPGTAPSDRPAHPPSPTTPDEPAAVLRRLPSSNVATTDGTPIDDRIAAAYAIITTAL